MSDQRSWPSVPTDVSKRRTGVSARDRASLARFQAQLDETSAQRIANRSRSQSAVDAEIARTAVEDRRRDAFLTAYLGLAQATVDRMLKRAETLATIAAAVATIYGAVLGVSFSLKDGVPLPLIGIVPAVLLGGSLVFVAVYLGSSSQGEIHGRALATGSGSKAEQKRLNTFIDWVNSVALHRSWALKWSVVLLGVGIATFPLPFLWR